MAKTRPEGSPLTPDDLEYWNQPYTFQEFPKMLYRRQRSGIARRLVSEIHQPEGTTKMPYGQVLEYVTVPSAADQAAAAAQGWANLATTLGRGASPHAKNLG